MKKKAIFLLSIFVISIYTLTYNSHEWTLNLATQSIIYEKDVPYLESKKRIIDLLSNVHYVAVVYPKKEKVYPNSIFHKYILKNPKESTTYTIEANVIYTVTGEMLDSITYSSAGIGLSSNAIFIGLCKTRNGFYAPDNGYEFPATAEAIDFVKKLDITTIKKSKSPACIN